MSTKPMSASRASRQTHVPAPDPTEGYVAVSICRHRSGEWHAHFLRLDPASKRLVVTRLSDPVPEDLVAPHLHDALTRAAREAFLDAGGPQGIR